MSVSIEIKLAAKPGAFARMYVEFGKLDIIPTVLEKSSPDDDGSQSVIVEFEEGDQNIQAVLAHLSNVDFIRVVNVDGGSQRPETEAVAVEVDVVKPLIESREESPPVTKKPSVNIFDNHKGRRDKF